MERGRRGGVEDLVEDVGAGEVDPRITGLRLAVSRLRRELAGHPAALPDRDIAEQELADLERTAREHTTAADEIDMARLQRSLLLVAGALGSVSALAPALVELRTAIDLIE